MANEKFWFVFQDEPNKKVYIDEPINFGDVDFNLDQRDNGMGRDVTLSGGKVAFKFTLYRTHYLEKLLYLNHYYGFEASVQLFIEFETGDIFTGELDFFTAETNEFDYFDCSVILESDLQIFRRRAETKIDLFSNTTVDGEFIDPLVPPNMLLQAKPSTQISTWKQYAETVVKRSNLAVQLNVNQSILTSDIEFSYNPFTPYVAGNGNGGEFLILTADSSLRNVTLNVKNLKINISGGDSGAIKRFRLVLKKGFNIRDSDTYTETILFDTSNFDGSDLVIDTNILLYLIGDMQRGENLWLYGLVTQLLAYELTTKITSSDIDITAESTAYNSIVPAFRLIDVMKQVAKSISGLEVNAPRYDNAGQFYDTVITNGNLLRNVLDKPFYVSWEDIEKSIKAEHNADSEISVDGRVFVGIEEDFYQSIECGFFDRTQFSGMKKKVNPMYGLNGFTFKYSKYQSLKEATEPNSESTIHGESRLTPFNKNVENSKEASVEWIRDAILLDVQQRLSTKLGNDTATQDDDTIFAIDTIETVNDQQFTESTTLQHTFDGTYLILRSNGEVNFVVLGIKAGTNLNISIPDSNNGNYTVFSVDNTELKLIRVSPGSISSSNDGVRLTKYTYEIKKETIPLTNRTNEGFSLILNLLSPEKYSNLRYSVERNIRNYWNSFLASVNLYWRDKPIRNSYYKNNGKCETEYNGLRVIEKEDFIPTDPIVTPFMFEEIIFANVDYSEYKTLQNNIRVQRGFIRTLDNNRQMIRFFPIKMSYQNKSRQLTITGQEKFEKAYLTISNEGGIILVNNETRLRKLKYEIKEGNKVELFDLERQRLYNGVYWNNISINGSNAETLEELKAWLDLLG